jgi:ATP-dependent helicase/nuclease subunit B
MAVQFILGRSGTGKTRYCIDAVVEALLEPGEQPLILLVPEQATYQAEQAILSDKRVAGYSRLHVLSFDRLQFLLLGKDTAKPVLSRFGQQMIIHRILRANKSNLKLLGASAARPGLSRQIALTIAELHQYAKTPDDVERLLSELAKDERNSFSALKFADIGLLFAEYLKFIGGRFLDPDAQLVRARGAVSAANLTHGARLWVDGFAGFTAAELAVLAELLKVVKDAKIALCLDPSKIDLANPDVNNLDPVSLFSPTERTYAGLFEIIKKSRLDLAEPVVLSEAMRFSGSAPLAHLERNLFTPEPTKLESAENIRIIAAPNERLEAEFAAREILELVKEKDFRYRDIAVIASDISRYEHYIRAYFDDYDVPFFVDKRRPLNHHPVVQLVSAALEVVTHGFAHGDIFACLKTDLAPVERYEVDLLENYCLAFGVSAHDWQSETPWRFAGHDNERFDVQRINRIRAKAGGALIELRDRLCPPDNPTKALGPEEFTRAVFTFLDELDVQRKLAGWIEQAELKKDRATVEQHQQFYARFVDIFDELTTVFAGDALTAEDYLAILNSAFSQLTAAFIPPTLDQVLVGSIERSRHPDLKAVFLIGATQKQFPVPIASDGILTDDDRAAAESADFPLAAASSQTLAERQYLAYIAFTRPSEFLCITYPSVDEKGGSVGRSQFVGDLESLFENLGEEVIGSRQLDPGKVHNQSELVDLLCSRLGRDAVSPGGGDGELDGLLDEICEDERLAELGWSVVSAISYDNSAKLEKNVVKALFGPHIRCSATRLHTFAACPYQHFARYVLELKEREEFKFEPLDVGAFYHRLLDALLKRLNKEDLDFAATTDQELLKLLREEIQELVGTDPFISNFVSRRQHNRFIINSACEALEDCVLAVAQMVRAGHFRPALSEVSFGQVKGSRDTLGEYELNLPDGRVLSLDGKIDRLDYAEVEDQRTALVFDYKRSEYAARFDWSHFYHGLDLQLPIYMLAVRRAAGTKYADVAGAFYMPIEVSPTKTTLSKLSEKTQNFEHKARGLFNGELFEQLDISAESGWSRFYSFRVSAKDGQYGNYAISSALKPNDFEALLRFAENKAFELAREILSGTIDVRPYRLKQKSPCNYCCYKPVCRFDWQINDYNLLEPLGKIQVLHMMGVGGG